MAYSSFLRASWDKQALLIKYWKHLLIYQGPVYHEKAQNVFLVEIALKQNI